MSGGVHVGMPLTAPEFAAATLGTLPIDGIGLFVAFGSGGMANEEAEDADIDLAGLAGRAGANDEGDAGKVELGCLMSDGIVG